MTKEIIMYACKTRVLLVFSLLLFVGAVSAQEKYLPAEVIPHDNESMKGFIAFLDWDKNPDKIRFRSSEDGPTRVFTPIEIQGFSVNKEKYISARVEHEKSPRNTRDLKYDPEFMFDTTTTFLKLIIGGDKSLYSFKDKLGILNFYIEQDGELILLKYKRFFKEIGDKIIVAKQNAFKSQLNDYLGECDDIHLFLEKLEYTQSDLLKLFQHYFSCTSQPVDYKVSKEKVKAEFGAMAGITLTSINFKGDTYRELVDSDFPSSTDVGGGIYLNLIIPRTRERWSVSNELIYSSYSTEASDYLFTPPTSETTTVYTLDYSYLGLNTLIRYTIPIGKLALYGNVGIMNGFALNDDQEEYVHIKTNFNEREEFNEIFNDPRTYEQAYILGLGLQYGRLSLDLKYLKGNGMSDITNLKSSTQRFSAMLGFRLF